MGLDNIFLVILDTVKKLWMNLQFSVMAAWKGPKSSFPKVEFGWIFFAAPSDPHEPKKHKTCFLSKMSGLAKFTVNSYWPNTFSTA